jgi:hypothetical protein
MSGDGDPRSATTILAGLISVILLLALVLFAVVLFLHTQAYEDQRKLYEPKYQELADLQAAQRDQINRFRVIDAAAGTYAIPIDDAIVLYARRQKNAPTPTTVEQAGDDPNAPE